VNTNVTNADYADQQPEAPALILKDKFKEKLKNIIMENKTKEIKEVRLVDFSSIMVEDIEGKLQKSDLSMVLGNMIYSQSKDIGEAELARDIYKNGRVEISKEQSEVIKKFSESFTFPAKSAIEKAVKF